MKYNCLLASEISVAKIINISPRNLCQIALLLKLQLPQTNERAVNIAAYVPIKPAVVTYCLLKFSTEHIGCASSWLPVSYYKSLRHLAAIVGIISSLRACAAVYSTERQMALRGIFASSFFPSAEHSFIPCMLMTYSSFPAALLPIFCHSLEPPMHCQQPEKPAYLPTK